MARFVAGVMAGVIITTLAGAAVGLHADDIEAAASEAGVDPQDLQGVVNTMGIDPRVYLRSEGLLERATSRPPSVAVSPPAPTSGAFSARVECIIAKESGGANIANRRGSGAVGIAQYMPSTFAAHAREMGHPEWSAWNPDQARAVAAHDLALGRRSQWSVGGC